MGVEANADYDATQKKKTGSEVLQALPAEVVSFELTQVVEAVLEVLHWDVASPIPCVSRMECMVKGAPGTMGAKAKRTLY